MRGVVGRLTSNHFYEFYARDPEILDNSRDVFTLTDTLTNILSVNSPLEGFQDISRCNGNEILKPFAPICFSSTFILRTQFDTGHFENFNADNR